MAKAEDLTGKEYGYLKVLYRATDHVTPSGQKRIRWMCECTLCGTHKEIGAQEIRNGSTISCGCYQAIKGKSIRNKRACVICGKEFETPPSSNSVTCSPACRSEYVRRRMTGKKRTDETRQKISNSTKGRDMSALSGVGKEAAKRSPNSGRFETNVNAIDWHLISPEGKHYYFRSLNNWLRENCLELFGCEPDSREYRNTRSGLTGAKRAMLGKNYGCCTYKGWQVIPTEKDKAPE